MDLHKLALSSSSSSSHGYGRRNRAHRNSGFSIPRCRLTNTVLCRPNYLKCSVPAAAGKKNPSLVIITSSDQHRNMGVCAHDSSSQDETGINNKSRLGVFCEFLKTYTLIGCIIFCISRTGRVFVVGSSSLLLLLLDMSLVFKLVSGLISAMCYNCFTGGINQIYDIEIDRINKPNRPLSSGNMSVRTAWALTVSYPVLGLAIVIANKAEPCVVFSYCLCLFIAGAYSVPPIRFKRFPAFASFIIGLNQIICNFGIYRALKATFPAFAIQWTPPFSFITVFDVVIFFVLAIVKDIPDIEGDRKHQIFTLAAALGPKYTVFLGSGIVILLYVVAIGVSIVMSRSFNNVVMIPSHVIMAFLLIYRVWVLHNTKYTQKQCQHFYLFLWNLVLLENFIFPFI